MRRSPVSRTLLLVPLAALLAGCGQAKAPFTSSAGKFRVDMPGKPTEQVKDVPAPPPIGNLKLYAYQANEWNGISYSVMYSDYPAGMVRPEAVQPVLDGVASGFIRGANFQEKETKKLDIYGHPGREVSFSTKSTGGAPGQGRARMFLVGDRLYQIVVAGPEAKVTDSVVSDFFKSFTLTEK